MQSFEPGLLQSQPPDHALAMTLRRLGEYKGKQELWREQSPQILESLRVSAIIESTESSNRIEGVVAPHNRVVAIVKAGAPPRSRSEQEIAGYHDVLATIHASWDALPFTPNVVLQLHRDLYKYAGNTGGRWKSVDNEIAERAASGVRRVRFRPVPAHATPAAMRQLHQRFTAAWDRGAVDRLLLAGAYVLDFLCIHPFLDGNGRMARLLSLWLLYRAGFEVGRYISLERVIEEHRDQYYETLYASSADWHEARHELRPWWSYFLGVMLTAAYAEFEERAGVLSTMRGAKGQAVRAAVARLPAQFRYADVARLCPGVSRPTIERALTELRAAGRISVIKSGRGAIWQKTEG
ncbi:MAG: Fic family protein [Gemmatimonadota bacterium]